MGVFLNTAAYGYYPPSTGVGCTATSQEAGYTYYYMRSFWDVSIPRWTVRFKNTLTGSIGGAAGTRFGAGCVSCNAQYYTASFGGAQAKIGTGTESNRAPSGSALAYGIGGWLVAFSSESCYVDTWEATSGPTCSNIFATTYGGNFSTATRGFITRDYTKYNASSWVNQPYLNTCATYNTNGNANANYTTCSDGSRTQQLSLNTTVCAREYQYNFPSGSQTALTITNYYTGSCGTY
jgi:hypothetical protein